MLMLNGNNHIKAKKKERKKKIKCEDFLQFEMFIKDPDVHMSLQLSLRDS